MKVAVTTANGQLGSAIIMELIKILGKENVIGIARTPEKASSLGIKICKGDYNRKEDFDAAFKGIDTKTMESAEYLKQSSRLSNYGRYVLFQRIICSLGDDDDDAGLYDKKQRHTFPPTHLNPSYAFLPL